MSIFSYCYTFFFFKFTVQTSSYYYSIYISKEDTLNTNILMNITYNYINPICLEYVIRTSDHVFQKKFPIF